MVILGLYIARKKRKEMIFQNPVIGNGWILTNPKTLEFIVPTIQFCMKDTEIRLSIQRYEIVLN
jgi:hypothetical protein